MTTIAYDGRYIAADSRVTQNSWINSDSHNKTVEVNGWVLFCSGDLYPQEDFIAAFFSGEKLKGQVKVGAIGYERSTKKVFYISEHDEFVRKSQLTYADAIGSGADHAITAIDCGKSAVDAVRMAAKRDTYTGGLIRCFDTTTGKFIKVKQ